ncbi:MAG: pirin family protein [Rhodospirillales bacterium]|nr:pirin family protein [Rhodospirillales bacterium]
MIKVYPYESLGHSDYGWLDARYHFSFARYHNPDRMGFGTLRVINDDIVRAGAGFAPHGHDNMEIITYVRKGAISHKDSAGNEGRTAAGDVQVMSAGSGIEHSEFNREDEDTSLYQIWIIPRERDVAPRWDARRFPDTPAHDRLPTLVSGYENDQGQDVLFIHADAAIYGGRIDAGAQITQPLRGQAYLLVSEGSITLDGQTLRRGDGAEVTDMATLPVTALADSEVVIIDVA